MNATKNPKKEQKKEFPEIKPGHTVRVFERIKEGDKERIRPFEGVVLARKHGNEIGATIIVRKVIKDVGVEKTFPLHSPTIEKIEIARKGRVRRAKLYHLRTAKGKRARIKERK